ncbi:hypothetical protein Afil01_15490 [Actinorhabdospora filicis]|uniref:Pyrrolidone-carboxylate peptidase n=1 Tax=Actinorhabdospora filicis TaxID=1785913 RepID=A0A9W6SJ35_9ACTN|nr:hypothetical protein [Actinorhabdospora filicis]GLZ76742.1 hypothetical protein Afil01_15490 [Actinorhabdospora filicis]
MTRRLLTALALLAALLAPAPAAAASPPSCRDASVPLTVEEQRLTRTIGTDPVPVAQRLIAAGGLTRLVANFERSLCSGHPDVALQGRLLWETAVARKGDDRPLYWARLAMTAALRQWKPRHPVDKPALEHRFEYASRGIDSSDFARGVRKIFVSGFDPFTLDRDLRQANPSGANAIALDGRWLRVGRELVQIQTVVLPVRYADFDEGIAEDAFRPHFQKGPQRADLAVTVSQGRPGRFDLEIHNGRRRSVSSIGDNNNVWGGGSLTAPVVFPGVGPGGEFVDTSLPVDAMKLATGAFPVNVNHEVTEIPAGGTDPVYRADGPTPGSVAVNGSGGGYLSNEVAYRASRLRQALGANIGGGHVHTPVLAFGPGNTTELSDPVFEKNRADILAQLEAILRAGAETL